MNKTYKTFDLRTLKGLKQSEQYKAYLNNKYNKVVVDIGFNTVSLYGINHI